MTASARRALVEARRWPVAASLSADDLAGMEQMLARPLVTSAPLAAATRERIQRLLWCYALPDTGASRQAGSAARRHWRRAATLKAAR